LLWRQGYRRSFECGCQLRAEGYVSPAGLSSGSPLISLLLSSPALTAFLNEDKETQDKTKVGSVLPYKSRLQGKPGCFLYQYYFTALLYATAGITLVKFLGVRRLKLHNESGRKLISALHIMIVSDFLASSSNRKVSCEVACISSDSWSLS
jgi:hypothetical protein